MSIIRVFISIFLTLFSPTHKISLHTLKLFSQCPIAHILRVTSMNYLIEMEISSSNNIKKDPNLVKVGLLSAIKPLENLIENSLPWKLSGFMTKKNIVLHVTDIEHLYIPDNQQFKKYTHKPNCSKCVLIQASSNTKQISSTKMTFTLSWSFAKMEYLFP